MTQINTDIGVIIEEASFPLTVESTNSENLSAWIKIHNNLLDQWLQKHGAILFKRFAINSPTKLNEVASAFSNLLLDYVDRAAPRIKLADKVYSSTEYAKEEIIPLHHEMSYSSTFPAKIFFCCEKASITGGFTPIADDRKVIKDISTEIIDRFVKKKVMYVRNYGTGFDMTWQEAFNTNDSKVVELILKKSKVSFEWLNERLLKTTAIRDCLLTHPITQDVVWFNHAHLFHLSNMPDDIRAYLVAEFSESGVPRNALYGDGTPIEDSIIEEIRGIYDLHSVKFQWEEGDLLLLDNILVSHGRTSYAGDRKICVALIEQLERHQI